MNNRRVDHQTPSEEKSRKFATTSFSQPTTKTFKARRSCRSNTSLVHFSNSDNSNIVQIQSCCPHKPYSSRRSIHQPPAHPETPPQTHHATRPNLSSTPTYLPNLPRPFQTRRPHHRHRLSWFSHQHNLGQQRRHRPPAQAQQCQNLRLRPLPLRRQTHSLPPPSQFFQTRHSLHGRRRNRPQLAPKLSSPPPYKNTSGSTS